MKKTVLVIEDNEINLKLVKGLLHIGDYRVLESRDAVSGMDMARRHLPDMILMDIQLSGMDGLTATRQLKKDKTVRHIPVVALTSYAMEKDREIALAAGCDGYIAKPINTRIFLDEIESLMNA